MHSYPRVVSAVLTIVLSVVLGTALGLVRFAHARITGPIRTFAVVAALGFVALDLLPHALAAKGLPGLVVLIAGLLLVPTLELAIRRGARRAPESKLRVELGYAALLAHRVGDGAAMAVEDHGSAALWALGAHAVPVLALVVLSYQSRGLAHVLLRVVILAVASLVGLSLVQLAPAALAEQWHGWIDAGATGILVHVVLEELKGPPLDRAGDRFLDVVAAGLALAVLLVSGMGEHGEHEVSWAPVFIEATLGLAPSLLVGLVGAALWQAFGPRVPPSDLPVGGSVGAALRGLAIATPVASVRVLPVARTLFHQGVAPACVVAFMIASPELGLETLLVSAGVLGWPIALLRLGGAIALALISGALVGWCVRTPRFVAAMPESHELSSSSHELSSSSHESSPGFFSAVDQLLLRIGGFMALGLAAATYAQVFIPDGGLRGFLEPWQQVLLTSLVALPAYVCAPSAVPLAAVLMAKGLAPSAALVGLVLGSVTHLAALGLLRRALGLAPVMGVLFILMAGGWALGWLANVLDERSALSVVPVRFSDRIGWAALVPLLFVMSRNIWSVGIRSWLAASLQQRGKERPGAVHVHLAQDSNA